MPRQEWFRRKRGREVRSELPEQKRPPRRQVSARRHRPASSNRFARERPWHRRGSYLFAHRSFGDGAAGNRRCCSMPADRRRKASPPGRRRPARGVPKGPRWLRVCARRYAILHVPITLTHVAYLGTSCIDKRGGKSGSQVTCPPFLAQSKVSTRGFEAPCPRRFHSGRIPGYEHSRRTAAATDSAGPGRRRFFAV
jgi:hypothetical protein